MAAQDRPVPDTGTGESRFVTTPDSEEDFWVNYELRKGEPPPPQPRYTGVIPFERPRGGFAG